VPTPPRISVVTVCRNAASTLQATLDSVSEQDYPHVEHIVIDGGSGDGTVDIVRRNAGRLAHWSSEPDSGIYDAMNKGVAKATGDWVLFLNADDALFGPRVISDVFAGSGNAWSGRQVVYGDSVLQLEGGRTRLRRSKPLRTLRFKMPFSHQGAFVSTALLRQRPFDTRYRLAADFDFFRDVYRSSGSSAFLPSGVCVNFFRVGGATFRHLELRHREMLDIIRRYESGAGRWYCIALFTVRCRVPERLRDWMGVSP
jgi:glycosyltransferase involved in cell wall biosynthesis